ncbi:hypothetical protein GCM10007895_27340 [Paraferrimonas sedimenticola]|uniref:Uncharacterized protein n=1 Tax=Paraferrimonas sedimenticola TaxID=375674 RepID=A0AA37RZ17_9GAMM|nr:hypothetical protein GCM10007895_27340 [Paraferrimonas sedimenticola]
MHAAFNNYMGQDFWLFNPSSDFDAVLVRIHAVAKLWASIGVFCISGGCPGWQLRGWSLTAA